MNLLHGQIGEETNLISSSYICPFKKEENFKLNKKQSYKKLPTKSKALSSVKSNGNLKGVIDKFFD